MTEEDRHEPLKVQASKDVGFIITWADDHESAFDLATIRGACGCANCHELRAQGKPVYLGDASSLDVESAELVGSYGVNIHWNDGHGTGIYRWADLREGCPCDECRTMRRVDGVANPMDR